MLNIIGRTYEDPEGIWEVIEVDGEEVTVKNIQEGNINEGKEFVVSLEEACYYLGEKMKIYKNIDTGAEWTEKEIRKQFEMFQYDNVDEEGKPKYADFEEFMDAMLEEGRRSTGGLIEIEK